MIDCVWKWTALLYSLVKKWSKNNPAKGDDILGQLIHLEPKALQKGATNWNLETNSTLLHQWLSNGVTLVWLEASFGVSQEFIQTQATTAINSLVSCAAKKFCNF